MLSISTAAKYGHEEAYTKINHKDVKQINIAVSHVVISIDSRHQLLLGLKLNILLMGWVITIFLIFSDFGIENKSKFPGLAVNH